jgi:amidase
MQTYHEWMKTVLLITMSGSPALAVPAGFSDQGLPIGIQLVGPNRQELSLLQLAYAYESTLGGEHRRPPPLLHPA